MSESSRQNTPREFAASITQIPLRERAARAAQDLIEKKVSRRDLLRTAGAAVGIVGVEGIAATEGVYKTKRGRWLLPGFLQKDKPPILDLAGVSSSATIQEAPATPEPILSLSQMIDIVLEEDTDVGAISDRIAAYNINSIRAVETLKADTMTHYSRIDQPKLSIFEIVQTPAKLRSTPEYGTDDNLIEELTTDTEIDKISSNKFILGFEISGSWYPDSELGNLTIYDDNNSPQNVGLWIGLADAKRENGQWVVSPRDSLVPNNMKDSPTLPSIAGLSVKAVTTAKARAILHSQ